MAELMRPHEAAKLYRLGDAHPLRLTLATVRLTVTGPQPPAGPHPAFLTARHVWLQTDPPLDHPDLYQPRRPRGLGRAPPRRRRPLRGSAPSPPPAAGP